MGLSPGEMDEMLARLIPNDLPDDPDISYRPAPVETTPPRPASDTRRPEIPRWLLDTNSPHRRREDTPREIHDPTPFCLVRVVGEGGFGEVWEAIQLSLGRMVAVKRLRDDLFQQSKESTGQRRELEVLFRREALTTAVLEHPNIVPVHDLGMDEQGRPVLAMKMVRGERWDRMAYSELDQDPMDFLARHLPILIDVCQAVAFAHSRGIVHRDLKLSQVMVGEFGEVLLMDWGIAILHDPAAAGGNSRALLSELVPTAEHAQSPAGTPAYMAVEQTRFTAEEVGPWTDVYLLGGMLYFLLTGQAPHAADSSAESFASAIRGIVPHPHSVAPHRLVPEELVNIAMKALSKEPCDRHHSVTELLNELTAYMTGAGKRSDSLALARTVEARMHAPDRDYESLAESNNMLIQALALWPRNIQALHLRNLVMREFADQALANNDLVLARVMAKGIARPEESEPILQRISEQERFHRRQHRNLRILKWVSALLLIVVVIDFLIIFRFGFVPAGGRGVAASGTTSTTTDSARADWQQTLELLASAQEGDNESAALLARALAALNIGDRTQARTLLSQAEALITEDSPHAAILKTLRERIPPLVTATPTPEPDPPQETPEEATP
jgi:serine/threonine protein kinase